MDEYFSTVVHVLSILPSKDLKVEIPYNLLYKDATNFEISRSFGCLCFPYPKENNAHSSNLVICLVFSQVMHPSNNTIYVYTKVLVGYTPLGCNIWWNCFSFSQYSSPWSHNPTSNSIQDFFTLIFPSILSQTFTSIPYCTLYHLLLLTFFLVLIHFFQFLHLL